MSCALPLLSYFIITSALVCSEILHDFRIGAVTTSQPSICI